MTDDKNMKKSMGPLAAAVAGVAVGAAGVAAIALSDKDTRDKVGKKVSAVTKGVNKRFSHMMKSTDEAVDVAGKKVEEATQEVSESFQDTDETPKAKNLK